MTPPSGYISNYITSETGRGSAGCPWRIQAESGQRISITLVNFATESSDGANVRVDGNGRPKICYQYANIVDAGHSRMQTECQHGSRVVHAYNSTSNVVDVEILTSSSNENGIFFLLYYTGKGRMPSPFVVILLTGDTGYFYP